MARGVAAPAPVRFAEKIDIDEATGCWLWNAATYPNGYARFWDGADILGHRWSYAHFVGPIPDGMDLDHVRERGCRHRHCVNPDHLEPVSRRENLLRGDTLPAQQVARRRCPRGHAYSPENTRIDRRGSRHCRACDSNGATGRKRGA